MNEGDQAKVATLLDGLVKPTAIEFSGGTLWVGPRRRQGDRLLAAAMKRFEAPSCTHLPDTDRVRA